jgi:hypothetical protein
MGPLEVRLGVINVEFTYVSILGQVTDQHTTCTQDLNNLPRSCLIGYQLSFLVHTLPSLPDEIVYLVLMLDLVLMGIGVCLLPVDFGNLSMSFIYTVSPTEVLILSVIPLFHIEEVLYLFFRPCLPSRVSHVTGCEPNKNVGRGDSDAV